MTPKSLIITLNIIYRYVPIRALNVKRYILRNISSRRPPQCDAKEGNRLGGRGDRGREGVRHGGEQQQPRAGPARGPLSQEEDRLGVPPAQQCLPGLWEGGRAEQSQEDKTHPAAAGPEREDFVTK